MFLVLMLIDLRTIGMLELPLSPKCPRPASAAPIRESYGNNPADPLPWGNGQTSWEQGKFEDLKPEGQRIFFLVVELTQHAKQSEEEEIYGVTIYSEKSSSSPEE